MNNLSNIKNNNTYTTSLIGKRKENEDAEAILLNLDSINKNFSNINFFGLFDGHGGNFVSLFLKKNLIKFFVNKKIEFPLKNEQVIQIYEYINKELREKFAKETLHTGSTAIIVIEFEKKINEKNILKGDSINNTTQITQNKYLNILNSGDSRCVICRDNIAIALTNDHKPNWPFEKRRIESLGGKIKFDGFDFRVGDLSVSRAFGDFDNKFITSLPDMYKYKLNLHDKFIIIACDGLWDVMSNHDAVNFILDNCYDKFLKNRKNKTINIAEKLANFAISSGSTDNVSVIVHFFY